MNREIKFRGKKTDNNKWVYGGYFSSSEEEGLVHYIFCSINGAESVSPETLGQFTGLKDKNGIEIYEGDIVMVTTLMNKKINVQVLFDEKQCAFCVKTLIEKSSQFPIKTLVKDYEVIGNIYENPELLSIQTAVL